jgi:two-component system LytT family response regulator
VDYLLKPVDHDELIGAVEKVRTELKERKTDQMELLLENLRNIQVSEKRIALNSADKVQIISIADIIRCESQRNYTIFYLSSHKQILVTKTLKEYDEMLEEYGFVRVHHSHLINMKHLKEFVKTEGGYALMSDNSQIPVSVRKKEQLMKILGL